MNGNSAYVFSIKEVYFINKIEKDPRTCLKCGTYLFTLNISVLLILSALCSCQKYDLEHWPVTYPPEVEYQMNLFIDNAPQGLEVKPLTIKLTSNLYLQGTKVAGKSSHKDNTIYLDTTSAKWKQARTSLVMHELGHYVLRRQHLHDTTTILDTWQGYPISFMNWATGKPSDWNLKREDLLEFYMEELFNPKQADVSITTGG